MTIPVVTEIAKARSHDTWPQMKFPELTSEYQSLLGDHHRMVGDNSKVWMTIKRLRADFDDLKGTRPIGVWLSSPGILENKL